MISIKQIDGRWSVVAPDIFKHPFFVDLGQRKNLSRRDLLYQACAPSLRAKKRRQREHQVGSAPLREWHVLDLTAGWGQDAAQLVQYGFMVTALEAHPIVFQLLNDGLRRWSSSWAAHLKLMRSSAEEFLNSRTTREFDVVYYDPMFTEGRGGASPKAMRAMQLIQQDAPFDYTENHEALLIQAIKCANSKVVVKRPLKAHPWVESRCTHSLLGRSIRFDIYPGQI